MYGFLAGKYELIGKESGSNKTYYGKVLMVSKDDHLSVTRIIEGTTVQGLGHIEHALWPDQAHVLRVRFKKDKIQYETTYQWSGDLDNYARISGFLYPKDKQPNAPNLEALFIDHNTERKN